MAAGREIAVSEFLQVCFYFIPSLFQISISIIKYIFFSNHFKQSFFSFCCWNGLFGTIGFIGFVILVLGYMQTNFVFGKEA
jgi:hypothetical protein